jgi:uncharacterized protein (TIGR02001 family)
MKSLSLTLAVAALIAAPALSQAQDAAPAPAAAASEPAPSPLSFNVGVASEYRYRGISQTRFKPALQGGIDYNLPFGFYIGTWASTIKWIKDAHGGANVEIDLYGGYKGEIVKDLTYDVGVLRYQYPRNGLSVSANTTEIYGAMTFGPATLKYSHSVTDLFGFANSKNSGYLDASATFDVGYGVSLAPHVGYQKVAKNSDFSYTDYSLTASKDFSGFVVSLAAIGTDTKKPGGTYAYVSPSGKNLGCATAVLAVKYTF